MFPAGTIVDDKFEIVQPLATGGFGVVYKARQLSFDRVVALKVLDREGEPSDDDVKRFELEAKVLSELRHRNLVLFYGFGIWRGQPYMAMEFLSGQSLQTYLERRGHLPEGEMIAIIRQVAEALDCVHGHGVVHRDLKPTNIMLCPTTDGMIVKLIDFGLVKLLAPPKHMQQLTGAGMTVDTVEYMSPEQCLGQTGDHRSDLYALGCVIYRCLSGCTPFVSDSAVEIMKSHVGEPPLPLSEHPCSAHCDPRLQCIIDKALAKEANERYQSASEIVHDLEAFRSGKHDVLIANDRPSTSTKLPLMANPKKKPGKRWVLVPLAVLALLACSGAAIMWHGQATLLDDGDTGVDDRQRTSLTYVTRANDQFNVELRSRHTEERKQVYNCYRTALKRNKDDHLLSGYQVALAEVRMALFDNADEKYDKGLKEARHALENCDQFGVTSGVYELCICETANALIGLNRVDEAVDLLRERARRWA